RLLLLARRRTARARQDLVAVLLGAQDRPLAILPRLHGVLHGVLDIARKIRLLEVDLKHRDARTVSIERALQKILRLSGYFRAAFGQNEVEIVLADNLSDRAGRDVAQRLDRRADVEEIVLRVRPAPLDDQIDDDDVLVA